MYKKRLVGVITVKNRQVIQSVSYTRYFPIGSPEQVALNLDRWGVDEICVQVIDRSAQQKGPDLELIQRLCACGLTTPLTYIGGIDSEEAGVKVIQAGADRIGLESLLFTKPEVVRALSLRLGAQALIASLPSRLSTKQQIEFWNPIKRSTRGSWGSLNAIFSESLISECILIDVQNEGRINGFDAGLIANFPFAEVGLIPFGGINQESQVQELLSIENVSAVAVGNFLHYQEHAVQKLQKASQLLREPRYNKDFSVLPL